MNFDELHHYSQSECSFLMGDHYEKWQSNSLGIVVCLTGEEVNFDELRHHCREHVHF